jgi:hypothetical protein
MVLIAVIALDFEVLRALERVPFNSIRDGIFLALPMANVLAVCLAIVVSRLVRRGEVGLPLLTFLLIGGVTVLLFLVIANLSPILFYTYLNSATGLWWSNDPNLPQRIGYLIARIVFANLPLVVPPLLAAWATRGHRLRLSKDDGQASGALVSRMQISILGMILFVAVFAALLAIDLGVSRTLGNVTTVAARIGIFGALPMAHVLGLGLVIVFAGLARRGEVGLSGLAFVLTGGASILLLVVIADVAPVLFMSYIGDTAGLWVRPGQNVPAVSFFGLGRIELIECLVVCAAVTPLILVPALLAAWMTRGYRLILLKGREAASDPGRALVGEPRGT